MLNDRDIRKLLKPCSNKSYGAFYTIIILGVGAVVLSVWLFIQLCKAIGKACEIGYDFYKKHNTKRQVKKAVTKTVQTDLELFGDFENCLMKNSNTLFYTVNGVSNKNNTLKRYLTFTVCKDNGELWEVNNLLGRYLLRSNFKVKYCKSGNNKGSVIFQDLDSLEFEQELKSLYGMPVTLSELPKDCLLMK